MLRRLCPGAEIGERDNTIEAFTDGCERLVREELRERRRGVRARVRSGGRGQELGEGERGGGGGSKEGRDRGEGEGEDGRKEGWEGGGEEGEEQPVASDVVIVTHREAFYGDLMRVLAKTKCPYKPPYVCSVCVFVCCMCMCMCAFVRARVCGKNHVFLMSSVHLLLLSFFSPFFPSSPPGIVALVDSPTPSMTIEFRVGNAKSLM